MGSNGLYLNFCHGFLRPKGRCKNFHKIEIGTAQIRFMSSSKQSKVLIINWFKRKRANMQIIKQKCGLTLFTPYSIFNDSQKNNINKEWKWCEANKVLHIIFHIEIKYYSTLLASHQFHSLSKLLYDRILQNAQTTSENIERKLPPTYY